MTLETDLLLDRRRLKRRLLVWRLISVVAVVAAIAGILRANSAIPVTGGDYVARMNVAGVIQENRKVTDQVLELAKSERVKALLVVIDSPGGSVGGGEALYQALGAVAAKKPVVAIMQGTAASAGYMIAMPAARVFARASTITGSIGVVLGTTEVSGLMRTLGVSSESYTSGPLTDQPSITHPTSPEGRIVLQGLVDDLYGQFVDMVVRGRKMDPAAVRRLADGRAYTGRQALSLGLIDAIGGEADARAWLAEEHKIPADLQVQDIAKPSLADRYLRPNGESFLVALGKTLFSQRLTLDGAWAIWQPGRN